MKPVNNNLTDRQLQVAKLVAFGYSNKEISTAINRSVKTVEKHRCTIYFKTNCNTPQVLLRLMLRSGQMKLEEFLSQTNGENIIHAPPDAYGYRSTDFVLRANAK